LWIIYDLDDTLIQTSAVTTPFLLEKIARFVACEENVSCVDDWISHLLDINQRSPSSDEAVAFFLQKLGLKEKYLLLCKKFLKPSSEEDLPVKAMAGAVEILKKNRAQHRLALVSRGVRHIQLRKLKKAGIDRELFSKIVVSLGDKKDSYKKILHLEGGKANQVVVIGDRPMIDLKPAKELGFFTIHFKQGRGAFLDSIYHDFTATKLSECIPIITQIAKRIKHDYK
jgi:FMN phosphatase YigB (HAD superfamily)